MDMLLAKAIGFAIEKHSGQYRNDKKTLYVCHCFDVVLMLKEWGLDSGEMLSAAMLHDTLEDTDTTYSELRDAFGDDVANMVVTLSFKSSEGQSKRERIKSKQEWLDYLATESLAIRLIKAADRVCDTLDFIRDGKSEYAKKYFHFADKIFESIARDLSTYPTGKAITTICSLDKCFGRSSLSMDT